MIKKNLRERKEYLFKRQEEIKQKLVYEKKLKLKRELDKANEKDEEEENNENYMKLYKKNKKTVHNIEADDVETAIPYSIVDDEYKGSGFRDPKILISTSRDCSNRLHQFMQEIRILIPNSVKLNRGNLVLKELVQIAKEKEFTDIILLHENRGQPDGMIISHLPYGPTAYFGLFNVVLRHDIKTDELGTISEANPHLILEGFKSRLGERFSEILKNLFPVPKFDSTRLITFANNDDVISFRHHTFTKNKTDCREKDVALKEHGPRFDMRPYQILLGTLDMPDSQKEWVLRPYMNTSGKKNVM